MWGREKQENMKKEIRHFPFSLIIDENVRLGDVMMIESKVFLKRVRCNSFETRAAF
jgi:hypothetical protein